MVSTKHAIFNYTDILALEVPRYLVGHFEKLCMIGDASLLIKRHGKAEENKSDFVVNNVLVDDLVPSGATTYADTMITGSCICTRSIFYTFTPRRNGRHFPDDILKWIFYNENL